MNIENPKILIGTLYSGENEFEECKTSINKQDYKNWKHFVLKNLPNKEAHDKLYSKFMSESENYDLFIKLDADMVFRTPHELEKVVKLFSNEPNLDHAALAVKDWYSDLLIQGLHIFSNRCSWEKNDELRFVDYKPKRPGDFLEVWDAPSPLVDHSPNPSEKQAFRFGLHRALKIIQSNRKLIIYNQSKTQWQYLQKCWEKFERTDDKRLALALIGGLETLSGKIQSDVYDHNQGKIVNYLIEYKEQNTGMLHDQLSPVFCNIFNRKKKFIRSIGILRLLSALFYQKLKKIYTLLKPN